MTHIALPLGIEICSISGNMIIANGIVCMNYCRYNSGYMTYGVTLKGLDISICVEMIEFRILDVSSSECGEVNTYGANVIYQGFVGKLETMERQELIILHQNKDYRAAMW